jgi:anti-sigma regulatory factor (Ser/Thr protein kinase)
MTWQSSDAPVVAALQSRLSELALTGDGGPRIVLKVPAEVPWVPACRHLLVGWLDEGAPDEQVRDALALVATELMANAVEHCPDAPAVELEATMETDGIRLNVSNRSAVPLEPKPPELPEPDVIGGRGLFLVDRLAEGLHIRRVADVTMIEVKIQTMPNQQSDAEQKPGTPANGATGSRSAADARSGAP